MTASPAGSPAAWSHRRVLVTGGGGYLAAALIGLLREKPTVIRRLCRRPAPLPGSPAGAPVEEILGDLRNPALWGSVLQGVDLVFHLAGQTSARAADDDPPADLEANVAPMLALLEACRRGGSRPAIVFSGTVTEAGLTDRVPVDESVPDRPVTIYDLHKLMAERYLEHYVRRGHVRGATLRLANVYGPGPPSGSADRGVLNVMIRKALRGETLTVFGTGERLRDYVYIEDVARALLAAAEGIERIDGGHFVVGSGRGTRIADAIRLVAERTAARTGRRAPVEHVPSPSGSSPIEERDFIADSTRFAEATGWRPRVSLEEGLDRTIDSVLAEASGAKAIHPKDGTAP